MRSGVFHHLGFLKVLIIGLFLTACGVKSNEAQTMAQVRCGRSYTMDDCLKQVSLVAGTWSVGCLSGGTDSAESTETLLHLDADGSFQETTTVYIGSTECAPEMAYSEQVSQGTFHLSENNITDWTETGRSLAAKNKFAATQFKDQEACGANDWVINHAQSCPVPDAPTPAPTMTFVVNHDLLLIKTCTQNSGQVACTYQSRNRVR